MTEPKKVNVTTPEAKSEEKAAALKPAEVKKEEPKAKAPKKEAAPKAAKPAKKTPAKKATTRKTTRKAVEKKPKTELVKLEFGDKSYTPDDLLKSAKDVWHYDIGKKVSDLVDIELYVKPEESKVYYVFNHDTSGSFDI